MAARTIAEPLAKALGQPVVVDNRAGASGNIAADQVAKATDDHTLGVVINGNLTSSKMLYPKLPYDPAKDFTYLSLLTTAPLVLVAQQRSALGRRLLRRRAQGRRQVELRLGRRRLGRPPGHGAAARAACRASRPSTCPTRAIRRW